MRAPVAGHPLSPWEKAKNQEKQPSPRERVPEVRGRVRGRPPNESSPNCVVVEQESVLFLAPAVIPAKAGIHWVGPRLRGGDNRENGIESTVHDGPKEDFSPPDSRREPAQPAWSISPRRLLLEPPVRNMAPLEISSSGAKPGQKLATGRSPLRAPIGLSACGGPTAPKAVALGYMTPPLRGCQWRAAHTG